MYIRKQIIGTSSLALMCDKKVFEGIIKGYIDNTEGSFSFRELYNYVKNIAEKNNYFDKEENTEYSQIELLNCDIQIINRVIWEKIWKKELIIDFYRNTFSTYPDEFYFIKIKEQPSI